MKYVNIVVISLNFVLSTVCMQQSTVYLEAFTHDKKQFFVPDHIVNMCATLRNSVNEAAYEKNYILSVKESPVVIEGALACLQLAYELHNSTADVIRKTKYQYLLSYFTHQKKDLISIANFIHYLDPQDIPAGPYDLAEKRQQKSCIQQACEHALVDIAVRQPHGCDLFLELNPDMSPENIFQFIKGTRLMSAVLCSYYNHVLRQPEKSYNHSLFHAQYKSGLYVNDAITQVTYCTNDCIAFLVSSMNNDKETLFVNRGLNSENVISIAYDYGDLSCVGCDELGLRALFKCDDVYLLYEKGKDNWPCGKGFTAGMINQDEIYVGDDGGNVYRFRTWGHELCYNSPQASPVLEMTSDLKDTVHVIKTEKDLFIMMNDGLGCKIIDVGRLLNLGNHSVRIEKISLHPNGQWLYLMIKLSDSRVCEYIYNLATEKIHSLGNAPCGYVLSALEWSSTFVVRAFSRALKSDDYYKTEYAVSHIRIGNTCTMRANEPFFCMAKDGAFYIKKITTDHNIDYIVVPIIDDGVEKIAQFFEEISSFNVAVLMNVLAYKEEVVLDGYWYRLYTKLPQIIKDIFPIK